MVPYSPRSRSELLGWLLTMRGRLRVMVTILLLEGNIKIDIALRGLVAFGYVPREAVVFRWHEEGNHQPGHALYTAMWGTDHR